MSNNFQTKTVNYQEGSALQQNQYFYNPIVQKKDLDRLDPYRQCVQQMLLGYEQYSELDQAIVIFESIGGVNTNYYGENEKFLRYFELNHRLNIKFTDDSKYRGAFRAKYGDGLVQPDLYLLDIKEKEANCVESGVLLANLFRTKGIKCYFKINHFDSHVCVVASISDSFYKFHFQDIGNTMTREEYFNPDQATDEKMVLFWNMFCGKVLAIQGKLENAIQVYDRVQYSVENKEELYLNGASSDDALLRDVLRTKAIAKEALAIIINS